MRAAKPRADEPIRLYLVRGVPYYKVVLDVPAPDGQRRQIQKSRLRTLTEARAYVNSARAEVTGGTFVPPDPVTVLELHRRWLGSRLDIRERTRYGYQSDFKPVVRRMGNMKVQAMTTEDVYGLVAWLSSEGGAQGQALGQPSVVKALAILKQVLLYGVRTGVIRSSPAAGVKPPRISKVEQAKKAKLDPWTPTELAEFIKIADNHEWAHAWRLIASGLRRSEVCGLTWPDVDLTTGSVRVTQGRVSVGGSASVVDDPKSSNSERVVHVELIHPGSLALFKAAYLAAVDKKGLVVTDAAGTPPHPDTITNTYRRLVENGGLRYIRPHAHRHTLALIAHLNGVAPVDAARFLGHSLLVHLSTYLKPYLDGTEDTAKAIGAALAPVRDSTGL